MKKHPWRFVLSLGLAAFALSVSSAEAKDRLISVSGTCIRSVTPDRGSVTVTADFKDLDVKKATTQAAQQYDKLKKRVEDLKLENAEISTSEYSVSEVREWENNKNVFKGYRARLGLKVVTSNQKRLGEVIENAAKEGVRDVGGLNLFTSTQLRREQRNDCLKEASEQARVKAAKLAEALGAKLGEVVQIDETGGATPGPLPRPLYGAKMEMAAAADHMGGAPQIEAGKEEIHATVNVVFALK